MYSYLDDLKNAREPAPSSFDDVRIWSYGDVENNGVYYHPNLTHYAHQVFERVFFEDAGLQYVDLSGRDKRHRSARQRREIKKRMTFPVEWLHQYMRLPMRAGDTLKTRIDAFLIEPYRVGVRAWVYNAKGQLAAAVLWVRAARTLDPDPETIAIPEWFLSGRRA